SAWLVRSGADANARQAVRKLAEILAHKHGDTWLGDMTAGACASPEAIAAFGRVTATDAQSVAGQYQPALAAGQGAARSLEREGCNPGAARARMSHIAAMESLGQLTECLASAQQLSRELEPRTYIRLRARVAEEYALCAMRLGLIDQADSAIRQAVR